MEGGVVETAYGGGRPEPPWEKLGLGARVQVGLPGQAKHTSSCPGEQEVREKQRPPAGGAEAQDCLHATCP